MVAYSPSTGRQMLGLLIAAAVVATPWGPARAGPVDLKQTSLVSDGADDNALVTDPLLKNPWGLAQSASGVFWVSNQRTGTSTLYDANGTPFPPANPLRVNIPAAKQAPAGPTGVIFNGSQDFRITKNGNTAPASFVFAGLDGQLSGWAQSVDATNAVPARNDFDRAIFTGLTNATSSKGNTLYVANGLLGKVDTYDADFAPVTLGGAFDDPDVPERLQPFNVSALGERVYVTYAIPGPEAREEPEGSGAVSVFDAEGHLLKHLIEGGVVASPWGLALAPDSWGDFAGALLVGNFNNAGRINAFDPETGEHLGRVKLANGEDAGDHYLWSILPGNGQMGSSSDTLYFTAGLNDEQNGVFGKIELGGGGGGQVIPLPNMLLVSPFVFAIAAAARRRFLPRE